jgi:hypothetical protein
MQIALAGDAVGFLSCGAERWQQQAGEQGDDGNHNKQLSQGKGSREVYPDRVGAWSVPREPRARDNGATWERGARREIRGA